MDERDGSLDSAGVFEREASPEGTVWMIEATSNRPRLTNRSG